MSDFCLFAHGSAVLEARTARLVSEARLERDARRWAEAAARVMREEMGR